MLSTASGMTPNNQARIIYEQSKLHMNRKRNRTTWEAPPTPEPLAQNCSNILITGGIGDYISVECFMTEKERLQVQNFYLATRASKGIENVIRAAPLYPNLKNVNVIFDDWSQFFCFLSKEDIRSKNSQMNLGIDEVTLNIPMADFSITQIFPQIKSGQRVYNGSSLMRHTFADISKFDLPERYAFVQPYSPNDRQGGGRDFGQSDWDNTLTILQRSNLKGVVVVNGNDPVPDSDLLVNLSNMTSFAEGVEILKGADKFIGVDSCFAALACKFMPEKNLKIRTINNHYQENLLIYCAPYTSFGFVSGKITI
jgi:hypothetical protein